MSNEEHGKPGRLAQAAAAALLWITCHVERVLGHGQPSYHRIPVEVMISDRARRRALEKLLRAGIQRLSRSVGTHFSLDAAVVVQRSLRTDRQLAGCYQLWQRPYGTRCVLFRLALQVEGRDVSPDELLAVLAEQWISLAIEQEGRTSALVPVEIGSAPPGEIRRLAELRPDPLITGRGATQTNGQAA